MVKINWTDQAIEDLTNIAEFIRKDSEKYAHITVKNIRDRASQLNQFPTSGKIVPEIEKTEI
jgi:toxin ParE1/3/4